MTEMMILDSFKEALKVSTVRIKLLRGSEFCVTADMLQSAMIRFVSLCVNNTCNESRLSKYLCARLEDMVIRSLMPKQLRWENSHNVSDLIMKIVSRVFSRNERCMPMDQFGTVRKPAR